MQNFYEQFDLNRINNIIAGFSIIFLLIALAKMPAFYYLFLRFYILITSIYFLTQSIPIVFFISVWILYGIIYNPIIPLKLDREMWIIIDISCIIYLGIFLIFKKIYKDK